MSVMQNVDRLTAARPGRRGSPVVGYEVVDREHLEEPLHLPLAVVDGPADHHAAAQQALADRLARRRHRPLLARQAQHEVQQAERLIPPAPHGGLPPLGAAQQLRTHGVLAADALHDVERAAHPDALADRHVTPRGSVRRPVDLQQLADPLDRAEQDRRHDVVGPAPLDRRRAGAERLEQRRMGRLVGLRHDAHALHGVPVGPDLARRPVRRRDRLDRRPVGDAGERVGHLVGRPVPGEQLLRPRLLHDLEVLGEQQPVGAIRLAAVGVGGADPELLAQDVIQRDW
jgi:hypothetical protein